jgi:hypothetical protein
MSMRFNGLPFQPRRKKSRDPLAREAFGVGLELLKGFLKMRSEERREAERRQQPEFIIEQALLRLKVVRELVKELTSSKVEKPKEPNANKGVGARRRRGGSKVRISSRTEREYKAYLKLLAKGHTDEMAKGELTTERRKISGKRVKECRRAVDRTVNIGRRWFANVK